MIANFHSYRPEADTFLCPKEHTHTHIKLNGQTCAKYVKAGEVPIITRVLRTFYNLVIFIIAECANWL